MKLPLAQFIDSLNTDATLRSHITGGVWLGIAPADSGDAPIMAVRLLNAPKVADVYGDEGPRAYRLQCLFEAPAKDVAKLDGALARLDALYGRTGTPPTLTDWDVTCTDIEDVSADVLVDGQTRYLRYGVTIVLTAEHGP